MLVAVTVAVVNVFRMFLVFVFVRRGWRNNDVVLWTREAVVVRSIMRAICLTRCDILSERCELPAGCGIMCSSDHCVFTFVHKK